MDTQSLVDVGEGEKEPVGVVSVGVSAIWRLSESRKIVKEKVRAWESECESFSARTASMMQCMMGRITLMKYERRF